VCPPGPENFERIESKNSIANPTNIMNDNQDPAAAVNSIVGPLTSLAINPPWALAISSPLIAPVTVCVRRQLGERFYRIGWFTRFAVVSAAFAPVNASALIAWMLFGAPIGVLWWLAGYAVNIAAMVWFFRCDRAIRREIAERRRANILVHSFSRGLPRFGLPNTAHANKIQLPARLTGAAIVAGIFSFSLGAYLLFCAVGTFMTESYLEHRARQYALDAADLDAPQVASNHEAVIAREAPGLISRNRQSSTDPLEGFEGVLSEDDNN